MAEGRSMSLAHKAGTYESDFEFDSETERKRRKYEDLAKKEKRKKSSKGHKRELEEEFVKEEGRIMRHRIVSLNAFDRHKVLVNNYLMYYGGSGTDFKRDTSRDKSDFDMIRENHKFLWTEEDETEQTWAKRLAKKYYDKLFKEYCIADLSRYKENKLALRWRIEREVQNGKGQFVCGSKKCNEAEGLRSWEVNFGYVEDGEKKNALVKLRLCPDCSYRLNYHHKKKEVKPKSKKERREKEREAKRHKSDTQTKDETAGSSETVSDDTSEDSNSENTSTDTGDAAENIWSGPAKIIDEKSREDEFDEYFEDMFL